MDFEQLREYCLSKPFSEEGTPFGPEALVYKVGGKMFALISFKGEELTINLKNLPDINIELREQYSFITPGYHMNKKHWNTIIVGSSIDTDLISTLIDQSYKSVLNSLTKKVQNSLLI